VEEEKKIKERMIFSCTNHVSVSVNVVRRKKLNATDVKKRNECGSNAVGVMLIGGLVPVPLL